MTIIKTDDVNVLPSSKLNEGAILLIIIFSIIAIVVSNILFVRYDRKNEALAVNQAVAKSDKKLLDIVKILDITYSEKFNSGKVFINGKKLRNFQLFSSNKKCLFGKFNMDKTYEVYGYEYVYKDKTQYHVENMCNDLKEVIVSP